MTTVVAEATNACLRTRIMRSWRAVVLAYLLVGGGEAALLLNLVRHVTGHEGLHVGREVFTLLSAHIGKVHLSLDVVSDDI